jgi:hypothetical protein
MNGGASVAFLAFIGHAIEKKGFPAEAANAFTSAMQGFILGTICAVCAYGFIFFTNCASYEQDLGRRRFFTSKLVYGLFGVTVLCGFVSLISFIWASFNAVAGFNVAGLL